MPCEKEIYLLRHGDTGRPGCFLGSTDISITPAGANHLLKAAPLLREFAPDVIFCSPMRRCRESLEILGLNSPWQIDSRLREIDFGSWEGKTFSEVSENDPEIVALWASQPDTFCFPDGESLPDFYFRVREFSQFLHMNSLSRLLIVSHGGVIRHLICNFLGLPNSNYLLFDVQYAKYASLRIFSEGGILTGFNIGG